MNSENMLEKLAFAHPRPTIVGPPVLHSEPARQNTNYACIATGCTGSGVGGTHGWCLDPPARYIRTTTHTRAHVRLKQANFVTKCHPVRCIRR